MTLKGIVYEKYDTQDFCPDDQEAILETDHVLSFLTETGKNQNSKR